MDVFERLFSVWLQSCPTVSLRQRPHTPDNGTFAHWISYLSQPRINLIHTVRRSSPSFKFPGKTGAGWRGEDRGRGEGKGEVEGKKRGCWPGVGRLPVRLARASANGHLPPSTPLTIHPPPSYTHHFSTPIKRHYLSNKALNGTK